MTNEDTRVDSKKEKNVINPFVLGAKKKEAAKATLPDEKG